MLLMVSTLAQHDGVQAMSDVEIGLQMVRVLSVVLHVHGLGRGCGGVLVGAAA